MKIFIIFMCFMLISFAGLVITRDLNHYSLVQKSLKRAAEECAEAAALWRYPNGRLNGSKGEIAAADMALKFFPTSGMFIEINDFDVNVDLIYTEKFFHFPFAKEKTICRSAGYEWK